jgi:HEPN domain-containing protein
MPHRRNPGAGPQDWLRRARSNLARARDDSGVPEVLYEDLCFDCQQAAEKAFKAVLVRKGIDFPKVHSIGHLIELLETGKVKIPQSVKEAASLTHHAVESRYPGISEPVTREEYLEALKMAEKVVEWANSRMIRQTKKESAKRAQ